MEKYLWPKPVVGLSNLEVVKRVKAGMATIAVLQNTVGPLPLAAVHLPITAAANNNALVLQSELILLSTSSAVWIEGLWQRLDLLGLELELSFKELSFGLS